MGKKGPKQVIAVQKKCAVASEISGIHLAIAVVYLTKGKGNLMRAELDMKRKIMKEYPTWKY